MAASPLPRWVRCLASSSLVRAAPPVKEQREREVTAYVELFSQLAADNLVDDITELVRRHYPQHEPTLLDDVLASFVLHQPEHAQAILQCLAGCIVEGQLRYSSGQPPFTAFVALFRPANEPRSDKQRELACGEMLRVLTHYNRPVHATEDMEPQTSGDSHGVTERKGEGTRTVRPLTAWITDCLLASPLGIRSDYFRWCGGVMGKYARAGELRPNPTWAGDGTGKHPKLHSLAPRWAVASGAAVILAVCSDEARRCATATLTAAAVPALLLPPPAMGGEDHLVCGLPPLEPYARLFHRYYACATPGATERLLVGLLEAPPSWAPDALDAALQLLQLLRAAEDYGSSFQLPPTWVHIHFLRPIGSAMAMRSGRASAAAAALLFRILSQPALLFPPPGHALRGRGPLRGGEGGRDMAAGILEREAEVAAARANEAATCRGVAALLCEHGPAVEWRICALWEAAYGLAPPDACALALPDLAPYMQPPVLTWTNLRPLLGVFEHLPPASPAQSFLRRIFSATVEAILERTFHVEEGNHEGMQKMGRLNGKSNGSFNGAYASEPRNARMGELRGMVHCLFTEPCPSPSRASQLLADMLTACLAYDAARGEGGREEEEKREREQEQEREERERERERETERKREREERERKMARERAREREGGGEAMEAFRTSLGDEAKLMELVEGGVGGASATQRETEGDGGVEGESSLRDDAMEGVEGADHEAEAKDKLKVKVYGHPGSHGKRPLREVRVKERGAAATVDSYMVAALCALACEVQLVSFSTALSESGRSRSKSGVGREREGEGAGAGVGGPVVEISTAERERGDDLVMGGAAAAAGGVGVVGAVGAAAGGGEVEKKTAMAASAAEHTRRVLWLLETLLALVPASLASAGGLSGGSREIVAAAVVAAHVSRLLARSKACRHALMTIMRCTWDGHIRERALAVFALVEENAKIVEAAETAATAGGREREGGVGEGVGVGEREGEGEGEEGGKRGSWGGGKGGEMEAVDSPKKKSREGGGWERGEEGGRREPMNTSDSEGGSPKGVCEQPFSGSPSSNDASPCGSDPDLQSWPRSVGKMEADAPLGASDISALIWENGVLKCGGKHGASGVKALLSLLMSKQELALAAVPLLWQRLVTSPEVPVSQEGTSARRGWRQMAEALCNLVIAFPSKAAAAIVAQAEAHLRPWSSAPSERAFNARIVSLLADILRLPHVRSREAVRAVAGAGELLRRATEGMEGDGEACTLPQLELLEAAAVAAHAARSWAANGGQVTAVLLELLKARLPCVVRCLSHSSAHVRVLSVALLREILCEESLSLSPSHSHSHSPSLPEGETERESGGVVAAEEWRAAVEQCVLWEAQWRRAGGLACSLLQDAASSLGCRVAV